MSPGSVKPIQTSRRYKSLSMRVSYQELRKICFTTPLAGVHGQERASSNPEWPQALVLNAFEGIYIYTYID